MKNSQEQLEFCELLLVASEGCISETQRKFINEKIAGDKEACRWYIEFSDMLSSFSRYGMFQFPAVAQMQGEPETDRILSLIENASSEDEDDYQSSMQCLRDLGRDEINAPVVQIEKIEKTPNVDVAGESQYPAGGRPAYKTSFYIAFAAIAAMLLLIIFVRLAPLPPSEVATLNDSINAKWVDTGTMPQKGDRLSTRRQPLMLDSGIAEIVFDNNAQIIVESPAKFEIVTQDQIYLEYGRVYAKVPKAAMGFTVCSSNSKIIDLGTEFGVFADSANGTELHVIQGQTMLIAGNGTNKTTETVTKGLAKKITGYSSLITDIGCNQKQFVRGISSRAGLVWRGQSALSLASIVSGGDGFNPCVRPHGIDIGSGRVYPKQEIRNQVLEKPVYTPVPERSFVDGVFVPDGSHGPQTVTSAKHTFDGFSATTRQYYSDISTDTLLKLEGYPAFSLYLNDSVSGSRKTGPYLFMHANSGITFDLQKIRSSLEGLELYSFKALCGVSANMDHKTESEFWVLLDGRLVFHHKVEQGNPVTKMIDIPIEPGRRFLTLATTEGSDTKEYDCCLFEDPRLELKQVEK